MDHLVGAQSTTQSWHAEPFATQKCGGPKKGRYFVHYLRMNRLVASTIKRVAAQFSLLAVSVDCMHEHI